MARTLASLAVTFTLLLLLAVVAQSQNAAGNSDNKLKQMTQEWFDAFDKGDGSTLDQMEVDNLVLVNADGSGGIWQKKGPRGSDQKPSTLLINVGSSEVRRFGNTAILTGSVTIKDGDKTEENSETIVWIRKNNKWLISSGQWSTVSPKKSN